MTCGRRCCSALPSAPGSTPSTPWCGLPVCAAVYLLLTPDRRRVLRDYRLYLALAIGLLLIAPNLAWNYSHSFATFSHTAANANWGGSLLHPNKALEFVAAQFGVFGPILFGAFLVIAWRARRERLPEADRLLLAFSLPIIAIILVQAFLSRAHANWAAPAYVAATVLVVATMVRDGAWGWLKASFALHAVVLALLVFGTATAGRVPLPLKPDPFARTLGWAEVAEATRAELARAADAGKPYAAVLADDRAVTAELLYYMRNEPTPILAWRAWCATRSLRADAAVHRRNTLAGAARARRRRGGSGGEILRGAWTRSATKCCRRERTRSGM